VKWELKFYGGVTRNSDFKLSYSFYVGKNMLSWYVKPTAGFSCSLPKK